MTALRKLIRAAYAYGMKPAEVYELTAAEIEEWVEAQAKHEKEFYKFLSKLSYSTGILASMSLAKKRPTYDEVWNWKENEAFDLELSKAKMIAWAENVNRMNRQRQE